MVESTSRRRLLATGLADAAAAVRRRHPHGLAWMHGRADTIARDTILKGTALSVSNLLA